MNKNKIQKSFAEIFSFENKKEKIEHHEHMMMFRFLSELQKLMEELGLNKKELAKRIGTSPSYITQLFRGDKIINLHTLAKIEVEFDRHFKVTLVDESKEKVLDIDEDNLIKFLNEKYVHDGRWIFHSYKKHSIPSITYSEPEESPQLEYISNG